MSALDTLLYGYRTILAATVAAAQRGKLNFSSAFTVADNAGTESTDVGLSGTQSITTLTATTATLTSLITGLLRGGVESNALAGSQNDVVIGSVLLVRTTDAGAITWTGIAGGAAGRVLFVVPIGAGGLTINHEDAASVEPNRCSFPAAANLALVTGRVGVLVYDDASSRWRGGSLG